MDAKKITFLVAGALSGLLALPGVAFAESAVCTLARETAHAAYPKSEEATALADFKVDKAQRWHEAVLIHSRLKTLRDRIRARRGYRDAEQVFRFAYETTRRHDQIGRMFSEKSENAKLREGLGPINPQIEGKVSRILRELNAAAVEEWGPIADSQILKECVDEDDRPNKYYSASPDPDESGAVNLPLFNFYDDLGRGEARPVFGKGFAKIKYDFASGCDDDEKIKRHAVLSFLPENGDILVVAYNNDFGTGEPIAVRMSVAELLFEPLLSPTEIAEVAAAAIGGRGMSEKEYVDSRMRGACPEEYKPAQPQTDLDQNGRPVGEGGDGSKTIEGVTGRSGR